MEQKEDLRVKKTFNALFSAFQELITEKTFDKITVRELCSRAETRTATFYTHFSDKYDFFAFMVQRIRQQYLDQSKLIAEKMEPEDYISYIIRFTLDFLDQNETLICAVDSSSLLTPTMHLLSKDMNAQIEQHLRMIESRGNTLSADPEILTQLLVGAVSQISRWWFTHRAEISKEELSRQLSDILTKMIFK